MAETKARHIANLVEDDGDVKSAHLDNTTSATPTAVSDQANTSTGYFDVPSGTEAQRPGGSENSSITPNAGNLRFNTDDETLEFYTGTNWLATNESPPSITSISGTIFAGISGRSLTITGTDFNTTNISIEWLDGSTRIVLEPNLTPTSATSVTRAIPQSVYDKASGTTIGIKILNAGTVSSNIDTSKSVTALPSGGTKSGPTGGYYYHQFNASDTTGFTNTIANLSVDYLVVGGGGAGGSSNSAGGGGAGGYRASTSTLSVTNYPVTIGGGGTATSGTMGTAQEGDDSTWNSITSIGGGRGGRYNATATDGGSGGGGGNSSTQKGSGTPNQGHDGGTGSGGAGNNDGGGGGGGSTSAGTSGSTSGGGNGGSSTTWLNGTPYAGGGGGGRWDGGAGNAGGGGSTAGSSNTNASNATDNTGSGGGGAGNVGGNGGSGVVIIRYQLP